MVLIIAAVIGSVLQLAVQDYALSRQSYSWNQAMFTAEAGIDLGWNELNKLTAINTNGAFMSGWTYLGGNSWSLSNQTLSSVGLEGDSTYLVTVTTNSPAGQHTIVATGLKTTASIGVATQRRVEAIVEGVAPVSMAMLAKKLIDVAGNSAEVDSFNSNTGPYSASTKRAHGSIGSNGSLINAAGLDLWGSSQTGPGGTTTTSSGFNLYQPTSPDTGTNYVSNGLKVSIPDVSLPTGLSTAGPNTGMSVNTTLTGGGAGTTTQFRYSSVSMTNSKDLDISGGGTVQVYITGTASIKGDFVIASDTKVEFYVASSYDSNGSALVNGSGKAANFAIYGLPTSTSIEVGGNATYVGTVYAPSATVKLHGNPDFTGSVVGDYIEVKGNIDFHYDEALADSDQITNFRLVTWREY